MLTAIPVAAVWHLMTLARPLASMPSQVAVAA
jgi:hypothetical protein